MKVLVIGTGNYVTGRGTDGCGTVLPAIYEFQRETKLIEKVYLASASKKNLKETKLKNKKIQKLTGINLEIETLPNKKFNKSIDCVIIATPDHTHYDISKSCIERGLHTLVVKPLVTRTREAKTLIKLCEKNNVYGAVEFHKRWDKQNLIL